MNTQLTRQFKTSFVESRFISLAISIAVILLRTFMYIRVGISDTPVVNNSFLWDYIEPLLQSQPLVSFLLSTLCIFIIALLISELNLRFGVIRMRTSMPFYIPLILFSIHPVFLRFTPELPALVFIIWSLFPLLATYQFHRSHRFAFQFSALLAMASVFQIHALLFIPLWLVGLSILGEFNFRSLTASLLGIIMVYWIVFALFVFGDNIVGFTAPFLRLAKIYDFSQIPDFSVPQWGFIGIYLLFILYFVIIDGRQIARDRSFTKKVLIFFISTILFSFILQILYFTHTIIWIYIAPAFLTMIISHYYSNVTLRSEVYSFFIILAFFIFYFYINLFTQLSPF